MRPVGADQHQRTRLRLVRHEAQQIHRWTDPPSAGRPRSPPRGVLPAARLKVCPAASNTRTLAAASASITDGLVASSGTIAASSGRAASATSGFRSSSARSAWVHGHHAGAWSPSQQVPHTTVPPSALTRLANRVSSVVLPMPASPVTRTSPAQPGTAPPGGGERPGRRRSAGPAARYGRRTRAHPHSPACAGGRTKC